MTVGYLLDTHIWIWYLAGSPAIDPLASEAIAGAPGELWLSPISVWEMGLLAGVGRVEADPDLHTWLEDAESRLPVHQAPLNREVALASFELKLPQRDPADRFLAATALVYDLTLITADARLLSAPTIPTLAF